VVFEARSDEQTVTEGAFLTLAPNGINALKPLHLSDAVARRGVATTGIALFNERGRQIGLVDYSHHPARFGANSVTIRRGELARLLLEACRAVKVELRFSTPMTALTQDETGVDLAFREGGERFAAVIGCDGLNSAVRGLAFPAFPSPSYSGLIGTGGIIDVPEVQPTGGLMKMTFGRRAFFGYLKAAGGPVYWFNSYPAPESEAGPVRDPVEYARLIAGLHADDPLDNAAISAAIKTVDRHYPLFDIPKLPRWSAGRVLLMGDAAHAVTPHSGQGASLAIEDGVVLAEVVERAQDWGSAFRSFEQLRRARAERAIKVGRMSGSQKHAQSWLALRLRDMILPLIMPIAARAQESLYSFRADLNPLSVPQQ
jgi:2-polyprenyl-6-methoxyphenol hydroxylase-like FAD-dependent oxidoreductase